MTTGKWRQPNVPHKGWTCVDIEDLEVPAYVCDMCEVVTIRYVHSMKHPEYPDTLGCGCICAGHMEQDLAAALDREHSFKLSRARRKRWLTRTDWQISVSGNDFINTDGFNIVIFPVGEQWGGRIFHRPTGFERIARRRYPTKAAAQLAAFDAMLVIQTKIAC